MATTWGNDDVASFFTTKHAWRGKYKRIFSIGSKAVTTYNPSSLEVTNQWPYNEFHGIAPSAKFPLEFIITVKKGKQGKKTETMTFSTEHRAEVLTEALRMRSNFAEWKNSTENKFNAYKYHWSDNRIPTILQVTACSLDQIDPTTNRKLCSYHYKDIEGIALVSDYPGGFVIIYGGFSRLHLFASEQRDEIIKQVSDRAFGHVGIVIRKRKDPITFQNFVMHRLGKYSDDDSITAVTEFKIQKIAPRHSEPVPRIFSLSETCIIERDIATYSVVSLIPLSSVFALVRSPDSPQLFAVELMTGVTKKYLCTERDALLASLIDGVRASGNPNVHVKMLPTRRGFRMAPFYSAVGEEVEGHHLKALSQSAGGKFFDSITRFNCNVSYGGLMHAVTQDSLFAENKERLIMQALQSMLANEFDVSSVPAEDLESFFHAIRRLVAAKAGFAAFTNLPTFRDKVGMKVVKALKRDDDGVNHAAVDMLAALMQPMHSNADLKQEQLNKLSLLSTKSFQENLLDRFSKHVMRGTGALVISGLLDFLTFALCPPYSETTDGTQFDTLLELVAALGRCLFRLFQHPSIAVVKGAGMVMKAVIEEGDAEVAAKMQDLALAEGALPRHLHTAMFTQPTSDNRMLTNRQLSRHLVGLWVTGHPTALALLKRILPLGILNFLDSTEKVPEEELNRMYVRDNLKMAEEASRTRPHQLVQLERFLTHWRSKVSEKVGLQGKPDPSKDRPVVLRKRRQRIKSEANWDLFYYKFMIDHATPMLIWNYKTREELRDALEAEMRAFTTDKDLSGNRLISWNHSEFELQYQCLSEEIKIGDYYLRILLEDDQSHSDDYKIVNAPEFFNDLYHRFLLTTKPDMKAMCLQAMAKVYGRCYEEIGSFNDTRYIIGMLERSTDKLERDRLLLFIRELLKNKINAKQFLDANGMRILVDLVVLSHLHTSRATIPLQTAMIEGSPDTDFGNEKEWYYGNVEKERLGPVGYSEMKDLWASGVLKSTTRCWAQGLDGWKTVQNISQLKWCLMATGQQIMNETELAITCLNMMIAICDYYPNRDSDGAIVRPLPRAKRMLSDASCLPHIVQLLLTFDPVIVEKVALLLTNIIIDNPVLPRLYMTGAFFFILMYTGSNVIPIGNFLFETHVKQAFRTEENQPSEVQQRSILGHILPEAMICYLENYGADKFAEIFLGEFDTPEAIWSTEMRRLMIEKIAHHIADYSPRLRSNVRALYQYCPIMVVSYPQLENELFCNIYYLRHLCDTLKFPDWPIKEPVKLLKDILEAWKAEVEKKPPTLSLEEAHSTLGLKGEGPHTESAVRKAYFKMAQKYHPDKNPDGRDIFEAVSKAYEFICLKATRRVDGPDPENIVLVLKAQSILFRRYKELLQPYKYAGYPMLIKTIGMETKEDKLFSKETPLLPSATELAFHTINCSALNAEELRRENGIEVLQDAFGRCVGVLTNETKSDSMPALVCAHVTQCYSSAAQFEACREKITELPAIIADICHVLSYKHLTRLCCIATQCVSNLSIDFWLQTHLLQCGALWHLLSFIFNYDYTLVESGVESNQDTNQQEASNNLAYLSIIGVARMGGYLDNKEATPDNPAIKKSLSALLTPYVARKLSKDEPHELLKLLNSNSENPYLIWDNGTRAELEDFLDTEKKKKINSGENDPYYGAEFVYSIHGKELIVGEIFVRIYNEQPTFVLEEPHKFGEALIDYLGSQAQYLHSLMALTASDVDTSKSGGHRERLDRIAMALAALRNVIKNNPGVEVRCIGHFKLLFSLLRLTGALKLQQLALEVIASVTGNSKCVANIADADVLTYLLLALHTNPDSRLLILDTLHALLSNTKIVKEAMSKGALVYLLDLFCNSPNPNVRARSAELFSKMMADKLIGPKVKILLSKFLPSIFMDAMRDSPEASVHMFEANHENPELIWNDDAREKVSGIVKKLQASHYEAQKNDPYVTWKPTDDYAIKYDDVEGELTVGGVFLRLYIVQPNWVLRKPKDFMVSVMDKFVNLTTKPNLNNEILETVTQAIVCLFSAQPPLADQVPALGHLPQIFQVMASQNSAIPKSALQVIHVLSDNELCVRTMGQTDSIRLLMVAMKTRPDIMNIAAETLNRMFEKNNSDLVAQAIRVELIQFLLAILDSRMTDVKNPSGTKAQIVKAIKAMSRDLNYTETVNGILDSSSVWSAFRDQKHDLFISDTASAGYLTGPVGVAGYLTQGPSNSAAMSAAPPPIDAHQQHQQYDYSS